MTFPPPAASFDALSARYGSRYKWLVLRVVAPALSGKMANRHSPQWITAAGLALFGRSFVLLALLGGQIAYAQLIGVTVLGIAIAAVFVEWRETVYGRVAPGVYSAYSQAFPYSQAFLLLAAVFVLALVAACMMKTATRRPA